MKLRNWLWLLVLLSLLSMGAFFSTTWLRRVGGAGSSLAPTPDVQYFVLPECPINTSSMESGALCRDPVTGLNKQRDAAGVKDL